MRLFKRQSTDTSPQLVSATPISQDGTISLAVADENSDKIERNDSVGTERTSVKENVNEQQNPSSSQSCVSNRKGISTWGRKVGRRWDQLKRSDSSELLSVSGRRRRWSPNRKSCDEIVDEKGNGGSPELPKPKRISRVESLRNLFRSSERNSNFMSADMSSRNVTIQEEDVNCVSHYPMEKALSEGAIKNVPFRISYDDSRMARETLLSQKKKQISRSTQDRLEQVRVLDYILQNQEILKTEEGTAFARETLGKVRTSVSPKRRASQSDASKNSVSTQTRDFLSNHLTTIKRNLFNVGAGCSENDRTDTQRTSGVSGLEDLMNNLRLGCDESGYDSDSTRTGADSPDSGKSVPPMLKTRSFSITSDDYHGIDLSLPVSTPNKRDATTETDENSPGASCLNDTVIMNKSLLNESARTDTTLMSDGDDTDSCDEDTFEGFAEFEMSFTAPFAKSDANELQKCESVSSTASSAKEDIAKQTSTLSTNNMELTRSTTKSFSWTDNAGKPGNSQKETKCQVSTKSRKHVKSCSLNLLDNAASPCKDSPPAMKIYSPAVNSSLQYYSPKRAKSTVNVNGADKRMKIKDQAPPVPSTTPAKSLIRRELKTMKLSVEKPGSLGISLERREAARPYYVISKMDAHGEAGKSKQFRIGDEIVRICGRRIRGMSIIEARNTLRNCVGTVELQIAREPTFTFGDELGDTWGDMLIRTHSDSEVWTLKDTKMALPSSGTSISQEERDSTTCKIVGALMKDGKNLSVNSIDRMATDGDFNAQKEADRNMTGMRKFYVVKKRGANPVSTPRRATSLSMDLLMVTLEKGASKKLGFSIVGGADSSKGSMGIFVKDIMSTGQAAEEGTLRVGDEILAINGVSMDGLSHAKALQSFKAAKAGKMVLHVGRRDPTHKRYIIQSKSYDCLAKLTEAWDE